MKLLVPMILFVVGGLVPPDRTPGLKGYIDTSGKVVIEARFGMAYDFSEGLAGVLVDKQFGFIDKEGNTAIAPRFEEVSELHQGLARVKAAGKFGYIDRNGKWVVEPRYELAGDFSEGLAVVGAPRADDPTGTRMAWGYIDTTGAMAIAPQFYEARDFSNGRAMVRRKGGDVKIVADAYRVTMYREEEAAGYIDKSGNLVIAPQFMNAMSFSDGLACVQFPGGKSAYIDTSGKVAVDLARWAADPFGGNSTEAASFHEGLAFVDTASGFVHVPKWGYIDKSGNIVAPVDAGFGAAFSGGLARIGKGKIRMSYGYVNREGKVVIPPQYKFAEDFSDGLAAVQVNGKWGYIDPAGKMVIAPTFDRVGPFKDGLARVTVGR